MKLPKEVNQTHSRLSAVSTELRVGGVHSSSQSVIHSDHSHGGSELAGLGDDDLLGGLAALGAEALDLLHDVQTWVQSENYDLFFLFAACSLTLDDVAEDDVLAVEPVMCQT